MEGFGGLQLTEAARPVLRGEQKVSLRRDVEVKQAARTRGAGGKAGKAKGGADARAALAGANENPLWAALKARRLELAREQGVPPYVIFHDSTLLEILSRRPKNLGALAGISGVGQAKLARYGEAFLKVLRAAEVDQSMSRQSGR